MTLQTQPKRRVFSHSAIELFLTCRHKFFLERVLHLTTGKREMALEFGSALHKSIDVLHAENWDKAKAKEIFDANFVEDATDTKRTKETAHKIIERYYLAYKDQPFKVIAQGFPFRLTVPELPGIELLGEIDRIVDWHGRVMIDEFKSTSQLTADYMKRFWFDYQTTIYLIAARQLVDPKINAILADAALVAKSDTKTLKSSPLLRDIIERTDEQIAYGRARLVQVIHEMCYTLDAWEAEQPCDLWYENPKSCTDFGGCKFLAYCREAPSTRAKIRQQDYTIKERDPKEFEKYEDCKTAELKV